MEVPRLERFDVTPRSKTATERNETESDKPFVAAVRKMLATPPKPRAESKGAARKAAPVVGRARSLSLLAGLRVPSVLVRLAGGGLVEKDCLLQLAEGLSDAGRSNLRHD
jgi:hypothetical protein